jgi:hypothetical protein
MDAGLHGVLIVDPAQTAKQLNADVDALYELSSFKIGGSDEENVFIMDENPGTNGDGSASKMADMGSLMTVIRVQ